MKPTTLIERLPTGRGARRGDPLLGGLARRLLLQRLAGLELGELVLVDGDETLRFGRRSEACPLAATVRVHDARFYTELAFGGSVGAGESYVHGDWGVDDLAALMRILLRNRAVLDGMEGGLARLAAPAWKLLHGVSRNTLAGSRRNIRAHYDLGNAFFQSFLDPTLMYSSAVFERPDMTLEQASTAKLERICRRLQLTPADHVLEIGTGWGGFALHAARHHGCRVTTTTISQEQHALAAERIAAAGLADRITLLRQDYRELRGRYDKLVSIEMIEAVGHHYFDTFFRRCGELLAPHGAMLLQAITIDERRYASARDSVDFIKRHVFPGSCLPSLGAIVQSVARASDLQLVHVDDIGPHYATTLHCWRRNLHANLDRVQALGLDEAFVRLWDFYLGYCEGGFAERALGDLQVLLLKPRAPSALLTNA